MDSSGIGVASGDVDGPVAVDSGGRLQRRPRLDQGENGGRVAPHGGVVERSIPVHVLGVTVGPFLQEPDHHLRKDFTMRPLFFRQFLPLSGRK